LYINLLDLIRYILVSCELLRDRRGYVANLLVASQNQSGYLYKGAVMDIRRDEPVQPDRFWGGFAAGALIGTAASVAAVIIGNTFSRTRDRRIVRLEDSVQIGRPVADVFRTWANFEQLPRFLKSVHDVRVDGNLSEWRAEFNGKEVRWNAETTQRIPNEAIGWKSISGPKHTGRITFSPIGNDTLVHVTINYAPPAGLAGLFASPLGENLEHHINHALRDFKAAIESHNPAEVSSGIPPRREAAGTTTQRATGTFGGRGEGGSATGKE
jgi:uncharacterized membrane protein